MVTPSVKPAIDRAPESQGDRGRGTVCAGPGTPRETVGAGRPYADVDGRRRRRTLERLERGVEDSKAPMMTNLRQNLEGASREAKLLAVELLFLQSLPLAHEVKSSG